MARRTSILTILLLCCCSSVSHGSFVTSKTEPRSVAAFQLRAPVPDAGDTGRYRTLHVQFSVAIFTAEDAEDVDEDVLAAAGRSVQLVAPELQSAILHAVVASGKLPDDGLQRLLATIDETLQQTLAERFPPAPGTPVTFRASVVELYLDDASAPWR